MGLFDALIDTACGIIDTGVGVVEDVCTGDAAIRKTRKGLDDTVNGVADTLKSIINLEP